MKRKTIWILCLLMALSACGPKHPPDAPITSQLQNSEAPMLRGDSYWVLEESQGDMRQSPGHLLTDLTLWASGTARIREIQDDIWLVSNGDEQTMTWKQEGDGTIHFYHGDTLYWSGVVTEDGGIELNRFGRTFRFVQQEIPEEGALYSPAELLGVWLVASTEVEGDLQDVSGIFDTLLFEMDGDGEQKTLVASAQSNSRGWENVHFVYQDEEITLLDESLYSGCGNDVWSVRIGEEAHWNENGYPEGEELYVTLLDQNTLLQQHYFEIDGGPGVSYQTYKRFLPEVNGELERADLEGRSFDLAGYTAADGTKHPAPPGMSDFFLHLDSDQYSFAMTLDDGRDYYGGSGSWELGKGGTLCMTSEEEPLAGAVRSVNEIPEVHLWYGGGILWLTQAENEWDGSVDTMTDLEGNAFAAPENAVLVFYGDAYLDMEQWQQIPIHILEDDPDARQILVSCTLDHIPVWIEQDGVEVAQLGSMLAGESVIVQLRYPESGGAHLCFEFDSEVRYIELDHSTLPLSEWTYITVD